MSVVLIKLQKEIGSLVRLLFSIRQKRDEFVNQEKMVKAFIKEWSGIVNSLRADSIRQFKAKGKIKV